LYGLDESALATPIAAARAASATGAMPWSSSTDPCRPGTTMPRARQSPWRGIGRW